VSARRFLGYYSANLSDNLNHWPGSGRIVQCVMAVTWTPLPAIGAISSPRGSTGHPARVVSKIGLEKLATYQFLQEHDLGPPETFADLESARCCARDASPGRSC
jgi:hypothetical protein